MSYVKFHSLFHICVNQKFRQCISGVPAQVLTSQKNQGVHWAAFPSRASEEESTSNLIQAVGRLSFLETIELRFQSPCWRSVGGYSQLPEAPYIFCNVAPYIFKAGNVNISCQISVSFVFDARDRFKRCFGQVYLS